MAQVEHNKIDPELLEDGEHVLWAHDNLAPKKRKAFIRWLLLLASILAGLFSLYMNFSSWQRLKDTLLNLENWHVLGIGVVALALVLIWWIWNWAMDKYWFPKDQSGYYVGMITNQRLVLLNANRGDDYTLFPGDITGVYMDYSNGARALRLELSGGAPEASIITVTAGDLAQTKRMIESGFLATPLESAVT